uniref:RING finger protein 113A n=1 Tax=Lygus hesperus TaxID=30085 RepID=A0A146L3J3_LYGHE
MDFQPDICKDYKETGICGWGDKCKFLHERGEFISSVDVERQWIQRLEASKREAKLAALAKVQTDMHECGLCRNTLQNAVTVECKHRFCEDCLLKILHSSTKCPICSHETHGVYVHMESFTHSNKRHNATSDDDSVVSDTS